MHVINQPWGGRGQQMGDYLSRLLTQDKPRFEIFRACVAFAKASGLLRLAPALQSFMNRDGQVEIVVGIDENITTQQALELIMQYSSAAYVFNNPMSTFHPKLYLFESPGKRAIAVVGSSNLTVGGLYTNYETNVALEFDLSAAADQKAYESILAIFLNASDIEVGNAKRLDETVLKELIRARRVADEMGQRGGRPFLRRAPGSAQSLFPRTPVPPAPRIDPNLLNLIPKVRTTGHPEADRSAISAFRPWETFVMILGARDTRQKPGYSRDVYIPLAARDYNEDFWGWPKKFRPGRAVTVGNYLERRVDMLIRPVTGREQVVEDVRLYYYDIKREFRLNCSRLIDGAQPGDLLLVQKSPRRTSFEGRTFEFEAVVISSKHPGYQSFVRESRTQVKGSPKRWGYL